MHACPPHLSIDAQHQVGLVGGLASLLPGNLPAPLQGQAAQHARLRASDGGGAQRLILCLVAGWLGCVPQVSQHEGTPAQVAWVVLASVCRHANGRP